MLSATERKQLKARAHGLIKVRAPDRERTGAESVQAIGKVFVIYRKRDE
jgi:RNA-binding protein YhbY